MKIICGSCRTKYSISDDKIRGKVFKIRCKKCSNMMVIKGNEGTAEGAIIDTGADSGIAVSDPSMEAVPDPMDEAPSRAAPKTMISGGGMGDWHLVINEEQVGPFTPEDIARKFQAGEINADTFIWKEGFAGWQPISKVPEFASLAGGDGEATNLYNANNAPKPKNEDPFGQAKSGADDLFGSPKAAPAPAADPFGQDDPFGGEPAPAAAAAAAPGAGMTAARSESSVLFSLTNLQALAMGSKDAKAQPQKAAPSTTATSEGSGLIDIRSMSSALQFSKDQDKKKEGGADMLFSGDSAAAFAPSSMANNVLLPTEPKSNTGMIVGLAVGGFAVIAAGVVGLLFALGVFDKTPPAAAAPPVIIAANTPAPANGAAPAATPGATPAATPGATPDTPGATPAAPTTPTAPETKGKDPKATDPKAGKDPKATDPKAGKDPSAAPAKNEPSAPAANPSPAETPKPSPKHSDELSELLSEGSKSSGDSANPGAPATLSQGQISGVMGKANFASCKAVGTGKVTLKITINSSGSVTSATGDGSPLAGCVAGVAKRLKFPAISSPSQSFSYPAFVRE